MKKLEQREWAFIDDIIFFLYSDDDFINDKVLHYFDYFRFYSDDFAAWYKQNEEKTWFDLRLGEDGKFMRQQAIQKVLSS